MIPRIAFLLAIPAAACLAQPYLNLDFETVTRNRPRGWFTGGAGFDVTIDTAVVRSGSNSLRMRAVNPPANAFAVATSSTAAVPLRGRRIRYSGWLRTDSVEGYAGLWLRVDGPSGVLFLENMNATGPRGTTDWRQYTIEHEVSANATAVVFGALMPGRSGTAWIDGLSFEVDGAGIAQGPAPVIGEPTDGQLDWVRRHSIPFRTPDAGNGLDDLQPLKALIGNARVVGMGEATHGTNEFFRMKHRVLEYLATELGFNLFAIEANMPEAYRLNDYVLNGRGDPKVLLRGMYFWTWNTQEVLDMIEWMREFNASGRGRLQFTGFDMQFPLVAAEIAGEFVTRADPSYAGKVAEAYRLVAEANRILPQDVARLRPQIEAATAAAREVREYLESNAATYKQALPSAEVDWAIQNARIVEQATFVRIAPFTYRDEMMAANMNWILEQNPGAKALVWAHNGHVYRSPGLMGDHLNRALGRDYLVMGFCFHEGRYNAVSPNGLHDHESSPSFPGSLEYVLLKTGMPRLILDLRAASAEDPGSAWLTGEIEYRMIGAVQTDGFFVTSRLVRDYDAMIFFDETRPSRLLPFR